MIRVLKILFSSVQSLSRVWLFATPWTAARQASLSVTNSQSLLKLMSIKSVMPPDHLILCCSLLLLRSIFPSIRIFSNKSVLCISGWSIRVSASTSILPMNIQDWFPLGWTGEILIYAGNWILAIIDDCQHVLEGCGPSREKATWIRFTSCVRTSIPRMSGWLGIIKPS